MREQEPGYGAQFLWGGASGGGAEGFGSLSGFISGCGTMRTGSSGAGGLTSGMSGRGGISCCITTFFMAVIFCYHKVTDWRPPHPVKTR